LANRKIPATLSLPLMILTITVSMSSCGAYQDYKVGVDAVTDFHARLDAQQFAEIYAASDPDFKKSTKEIDFAALLGAVHRKLGNVKTAKFSNVNVNWSTDEGTLIHMEYDTAFEGGDASESFIWRAKKSGAMLYGYHIRSNALIIK
jgi:Protein of unknown function (DUF4019)